ncbi:hypothetical protein P153DRAFT_389431 [Dothidotthia symphoricarpi CBS 119687]|uniref:Uncharacterized protein n=1 Tax=Dothidotthia symphoricarpi CBS 119687 TaxID=1392245 RepID=A0A6A6A3V8_9PLEO|nr:uncharacterized protein P153DRAFT_389431 [Dothidotthia symphoricarpi CBS 119687]KAF2125271.1 hypothetical protein P153DRAFT_389431 [Dothidotthia symphoricarpi CBS 119687]
MASIVRAFALLAYGFATIATAFGDPLPDMVEIDARGMSDNTTIDPCTLADSPNVNASIQLSSWLECQLNGFYPFPDNGDWPKVHAQTFSKDVLFTFNDTRYDFEGSLRFYHNANASLARSFAPFRHGFINTMAVPNANGDRGGFVYMIGWAGGFHKLLQRDLYFTNAAFGVIKEEEGHRKIVEFREASNIPATTPSPESVEWSCGFT